MTFANHIQSEYFDWMVSLVTGERYAKTISYSKLLEYLHSVEFAPVIIRGDYDRSEDGIYLRYRFAVDKGYDEKLNIHKYITGPCSVLEMMTALAQRCEESIMTDSAIGDRTGQWFWGMVVSLGLGSMENRFFDEKYVAGVINRFLNRDYEPNGRGGLFTIKNTERDLRSVDIWCQMCEYLDTIN